MRTLIASDLHANLEAVDALPRDFDRLWVLGDLVNYGPNPVEVVDFVRQHASLVVRGNHDHSIAYDEDPRCSAPFRSMAEETRRFTRSVLSEEARAYLRSLPLTAMAESGGLRALLCHAAPGDLYEYRKADSERWTEEAIDAGVGIRRPHAPALPAHRGQSPGSESRQRGWQDGRITLQSAPYDYDRTIAKLARLPLSAPVISGLAQVLRMAAAPTTIG